MTIAVKPAEPYATLMDTATVRIERLLPGPVERVWSYLIDSEKRAKWFGGGPIELTEGGAVTLTFRNSDLSAGQPSPHGQSPDGVDHVLRGVITECEPPHRLAFNWEADGSGMESRFELSSEGPDTRLVITQSRITRRGQLLSVSAGWHVHLGILTDLLSETAPRLFWQEHTRLVEVYADRFPE